MESRSPDQRPAIDDNIRRTVEKSALRKVRKALDEIDREEAAERRVRLIAYGIAGVVLLLLVLFVAGLAR